MSIKHLGHDSWQSTLDGGVYSSKEAAEHYERQALAKAHSETEGSKTLSEMSAEQLKSFFNAVSAQADAPDRVRDFREIQSEFISAHPEYLANTANGAALCAVLNDRGLLNSDGTFHGDLADMETAYLDLAERGILQLKKGTQLPKRTNEIELYNMSAEELLKASRGF